MKRLLVSAVTAVLVVAYIALVFFVVVAGGSALLGHTTSPHVGLTFLGTVLAAVTLDGVRRWSGRRARRVVYGRQLAPPEVLAHFSERVIRDHASEEVLPAMAEVVADGTGAGLATIWLARGDIFEPAVAHPTTDLTGIPELGVDYDAQVAVTHGDETLGVLAVSKGGRGLATEQRSVLDDLAAVASTVLRNLRLQRDLEANVAELEEESAALRASQRRIVEAQDAERRILERDIHDGAQQYLTALGVKLGHAAMLYRRDPTRALTVTEEIRTLIDETETSIAELVRGIYPTVLAERGLIEAIRTQLPRFPFEVEIESTVTTLPSDVAAAVYFTCLGALQNVAKHARASRARVRIDARKDRIVFDVEDDGVGFDVTEVRRSGLEYMGDRISALGGSLEVMSRPGDGTTVRGSLPLRRRPE